MSTVLFALALFGCSDNATACRRLDVPVQTYSSRAECTAQLEDALGSEAAMRADAPTVYAQCLSSRQLTVLGKGTVDLTRVNGLQFASAVD
ncbi:hypothetical protein [Novosphingobium album (ex Hu et al. 2023)]|uniref:Lipoprotein n=1 Tax=Novosphingobium album (ex Hu et al. 2023) TaxID=2930093 RepID=A0ABT0B209_9SPHN|nr:hypothetical protein [Novosphingobium album (ex Hu et al. 2023)]MCJ2178963.1 hypothetical protein [Novosphingobium album (ex Hu et al. 2023)]